MFWRKKPRRVSFQNASDHSERMRSADFGGATGAGRRVSFGGANGAARMSPEEVWHRLGAGAWKLLENKRVSELLPDDSLSEFERIMELRRRCGGPQLRELFVGYRHPGVAPLFVPREVLQRHGYVLGGTGTGKTSHALAQLLAQLAEPHDWMVRGEVERTPVMILDLKPGGDSFLRAYAERVAHEQNRPFRFYSTDPTYESMQFDPFIMMRATPNRMERAEMLIKAFSLVYPEGYGSDFFTAEQRALLMDIMHRKDPNTFRRLIDDVRAETSADGGNKDARGLYSAISALQYALHVNVDSERLDPEQQLDFERFLTDGEILYVHVDSRGTYLLSRDVGKLMLFSLLKAATDRYKRRVPRQAFVIIDEFQRLAARNVVEMLEDARSAGIGFILAHQSSSALETRDGDLYGILFENCSFKQFLTLEDPRVFKLLQMISGRVLERTEGGATSESKTEGTTTGTGRSVSYSSGSGDSAGETIGPDGVSVSSGASNNRGNTTSTNHSTGRSESTTKSESKSWEDKYVPGLREDVITDLHRGKLLSLIHVKRGDDGITPTGATPTLLQGIHPVSRDEYERMSRTAWKPSARTDDDYLRRARASVSEERVEEVAAAARPERGGSTTRRPGATREARNELQQRLTPLYERLQGEMLGEFVELKVLASRWGISVERLAELIAAAEIPLDPRDNLLRPDHVALLESLLRQHGAERRPNGRPPKDNGPPQGSVT